MFAFAGRDDIDDGALFDYHLALKLHCTVAEVRTMGHDEYAGWVSYFRAKHAFESVQTPGGGQ